MEVRRFQTGLLMHDTHLFTLPQLSVKYRIPLDRCSSKNHRTKWIFPTRPELKLCANLVEHPCPRSSGPRPTELLSKTSLDCDRWLSWHVNIWAKLLIRDLQSSSWDLWLTLNMNSFIFQVLSNGNLVLTPFRAEDYNQEVHAQTYRCIAQNSLGKIQSRDVHVRAGTAKTTLSPIQAGSPFSLLQIQLQYLEKRNEEEEVFFDIEFDNLQRGKAIFSKDLFSFSFFSITLYRKHGIPPTLPTPQ